MLLPLLRVAYRRQHVQHGRARAESRRYYRRHRTQLLLQSRRRYKKIRHHPAYKRQQKRYHQHPERYHRVRSAGVLTCSVPFWCPGWGPGVLVGVDSCGQVYYRSTREGSPVERADWEEFLRRAVFWREEHIQSVFDSLDQALELEPDVRAVSDACVAHWLEREKDLERGETGSVSPHGSFSGGFS